MKAKKPCDCYAIPLLRPEHFFIDYTDGTVLVVPREAVQRDPEMRELCKGKGTPVVY